MSYDIIACGDLLTNYVFAGENENGISLFERHPAGTTSNLLSQAAALGSKVALVSVLGDDADGHYLYKAAENAGIDMKYVRIKKDLFTRQVFVYFTPDNDRYFVYNGTDRSHFESSPDQIDIQEIKNAKFFVSSLNFIQTDRPIHEAVTCFRKAAKESETMLAIDANYRGQFIPEDEKAKMREIILDTHVLKMTKCEMEYYLGFDNILEGTDYLLSHTPKLVAVTLDRDGCFLRTKDSSAYIPTFDVPVKDTTGAGDSFMGSLLYQLTHSRKIIDELSDEDLFKMGQFSNACASISTMSRGSLAVMPSQDQAENLIANGNLLAPSREYGL